MTSSSRLAAELPWQLWEAGELDRLRACLLDMNVRGKIRGYLSDSCSPDAL